MNQKPMGTPGEHPDRHGRARPRPERVAAASDSRISVRGMLAVALALAVAAVCVRLGFWQLDRLEQRQARNGAIEASLSLPPLAVDSATLAALAHDPERFRFRRVRLRGVFVPEAEVIQRGRSLDGRPGVYLLTPLRVAGSRWAVLVNRGWAPSPDALTIDPRPLAEPGERQVEGIVELFPSGVEERSPMEQDVGGARVASVQRLNPSVIQRRLPIPLLNSAYVLQLPDSAAPEGLQRLPPPEISEGPHLGYAVQWFSFAAIAVIGMVVVLVRARRARG